VKDGAFGPLLGLSGAAALAATDRGIDLSGDATLLSLPLARFAAHLAAPVEEVASLAALSAAPASAEVQLGPTALDALLPATARAAPERCWATSSSRGPSRFRARPGTVRVGEVGRGDAAQACEDRASGGYRDRRRPRGGDSARAPGRRRRARPRSRSDLSLPSGPGFDWRGSGAGRLDSEGVDLACSRPVAISLRSVAGTLSGEAPASPVVGDAPPRAGALASRRRPSRSGLRTYREVTWSCRWNDHRLAGPRSRPPAAHSFPEP
jgi:hypothetical protein